MTVPRWFAAYWTSAFLAMVAFSAFLGCGGSKLAHSSKGGAESAASETSQGSSSGGHSGEAANGGAGVRTDAAGRKFVGAVPFDVFYEDPIAVYSNRAVAAKPADAVEKPAADKPAETAGATGAPAAAGGAPDWGTILPISILDAEVKKTRNHLTDALSTLGKYNGNYKDIQNDGAVLAALAGIVIEHPDKVSWKENAKYVRDLGAKIETKSQELGAKSFKDTETAFKQLAEVLDGNKPGDLPEAKDKVPFAESAAVLGLMKRMDKVKSHAKSNVNTEAIFKASTEELTHEGAMLQACAQVLAAPGFPSADEEQYKKHMADLLAACADFRKAVQTQDYKLFENSVNKIQKKCDECHVDYRFGDK